MKNWFSRLFNHPQQSPAPISGGVEGVPAHAEVVMDLQRELQNLRLAAAENERVNQALKQDVERLRARQAELAGAAAAVRLEALLAEVAAPASQIITQADLLENQARPVEARDVLTVARRLVRGLERHGLTFEGRPGEPAVFDPSRHTPIGSPAGSPAPQPGQPVTVRFAGVSYAGKIIYKAVVE